MSSKTRHAISRRTALVGFAVTAVSDSVGGQTVADTKTIETSAGPVFSLSGPNAELYGATDGFPIPSRFLARLQGNPFEPKYRVGAFSHFDELFPTRRIEPAATPWAFKRAAADIRYSYRGNPSSLEDYLSRNPVTGLLVAKDDRILFEHYQYGRTDRDRLISQSMVKSITGLLIGIAVAEARSSQSMTRPKPMCPGLEAANTARRRSATSFICPRVWTSAKTGTAVATSIACGVTW